MLNFRVYRVCFGFKDFCGLLKTVLNRFCKGCTGKCPYGKYPALSGLYWSGSWVQGLVFGVTVEAQKLETQ